MCRSTGVSFSFSASLALWSSFCSWFKKFGKFDWDKLFLFLEVSPLVRITNFGAAELLVKLQEKQHKDCNVISYQN